jgi:two-component system sensor histidine kinase ResE
MYSNKIALIDELKRYVTRLEQEKKELESLLTHVLPGALLVDRQGTIKIINSSAKKILKLPADTEFVESSFLKNVLGFNPVELLIESKKEIIKKEVRISEGTYQVMVSGVRDEFQALTGAVVVILDITEEKKLQEREADFIAMIVHDLKSPMTVIKGGAEVILNQVIGGITEEQKAILFDIQSASERAIGLIDNFLELSQLEFRQRKLDLRKVNMEELILKALMAIHLLAQKKNLVLTHHIEENLPPALGEAEKLERVLVNLLNNAVKFTPEGGQIEAKVRLVQLPEEQGEFKKRRMIQVDISDTGPGVAMEDQELIFEKYQQAKVGRSQEYRGTGLGLAICKMIIDAHNGKIWVHSEPGRGSTFSFLIPVAEQNPI